MAARSRRKSEPSSRLMSLWREVANEMATWCCTSAGLDLKKAEVRVKAEGIAFFTISLPKYAKAFERALELGRIEPGSFSGFQKKSGLPLFLGGFLAQVFDSSGYLLQDPSVDCIFAIRQLTLMYKKIEMPCKQFRTDRAIAGYLKCEQELARADTNNPEELFPQFQRAARVLWSEAFSCVDQSVYEGTLIPRHGPGATADGIKGNLKFNQREWPLRMEGILPYGDYAFPSWRLYDHEDPPMFLEPGSERPVKVITVPKTLDTPRIIAVEPTANQYGQQAVAQCLIEVLENGTCPHPHGGGHKFDNTGFVGFEVQEVNQLLALEGSVNRSLATLDLSEASDRVSNGHVELLFSGFPHLGEAVQATRSLKARIPPHFNHPGIILELRKFASMGSALCFPVEALVFCTIVFAAIADQLKVPLTQRVINSFRGKVRVYGDDIIVPVEYVRTVIRYLEAFGLKVNSDKSFWNGKFRESCGGEYYDGEWVTPVRVRRVLPDSLSDIDEVVSLVSLRNRFYWAGMWETARYLDSIITPLFKGDYNVVATTCADLGRESVLTYKWWRTELAYKPARRDPKTHVPLVRGVRVRRKIPLSRLNGAPALLKFFLKQGESPSQDEKHLERQGRAIVVGITRGWIRPY